MNSTRPLPPFLVLLSLLTALAALGQMSISVYTPSFPAIAEELQASTEQVNLTLAVFFFGFSFSQLVYGPLSDRFGRRPTLIGGIVLYGLASLACAQATSIEALIFLRFCQALGASAGPVLSRAVVRDLYSGERAAQVMAYAGIAFALVPAVLPTLGGYLQAWFGWQSNFVFLCGVALVIGSAVWVLLPETNKAIGQKLASDASLMAAYKVLVRNRIFLGYMIMIGGVFGGLMVFTASAPFLFIQTMGVPAERFGLMLLPMVLGFLSGTFLAGKLAKKVGVRRMALTGATLALAGGLIEAGFALGGIFHPAVIIGPMLIYLAGLALVMPSGFAGAMEPFPRFAGAASGLIGCFQMLSATAGSAAAGVISHQSQLPMAMLIVGCAATGFLGLMVLVRPLGGR